VSHPSDGCGFSSIRLRMSYSEAAISGLDAKKIDPEITAFLLPFLNSAPIRESPLLHMFNLLLSTGTFPSKWRDSSFLFLRPVNVMTLVIIVMWQYFHALRNCSRSQYMINFFFRSNLLLCLLNTDFLNVFFYTSSKKSTFKAGKNAQIHTIFFNRVYLSVMF
jgi:hypothetical protein